MNPGHFGTHTFPTTAAQRDGALLPLLQPRLNREYMPDALAREKANERVDPLNGSALSLLRFHLISRK
jgi:hypothetical protein